MNVKQHFDWEEYHYQTERNYARKILSSPPNSELRSELLREGYDKIKQITDQYSPGLSETGHTQTVMSIVQHLVKKGAAVLDIGCARGSLITALYKEGYAVRGIDISLDYVKRGKEELVSLGIANCVEYGDINHYEYNGSFDCIVMDNVIEHIEPDTVKSVIRKCWRMLSGGSCLILITPHRYSGPHDISYHFLPLGSKAEGFHFKEYTFKEVSDLLKGTGFNEVLGFPVFPGCFKKYRASPSAWAARKAEICETIMEKTPLGRILKIDRRVTGRIVSLLFPGICIGIKEEM